MTPRVGARWSARAKGAALVAAAAALDGVAAGLVLTAGPHAVGARALAAGLHALAVLGLVVLGRREPSRTWLAAVAVAALPCLGTLVAAVVLLTRGEGTLARLVPRPARRARRPDARWARHVLLEIAPCDALAVADADPEARRAALVTLLGRGDADATAALRWAVSQLDADGALLAALALDETSSRRLRAADHASRAGRSAPKAP